VLWSKLNPGIFHMEVYRTRIYILTALFGDVMLSSWVSSPWCFQGTGIV